MSKNESAIKLANIIRNSELHNRSTLDIDEVYEEVTDIVKNIHDAGFRDITDLRDWLDEKWNFDYNDAWYLALEPVDKGKVQMARTVLDRLREL